MALRQLRNLFTFVIRLFIQGVWGSWYCDKMEEEEQERIECDFGTYSARKIQLWAFLSNVAHDTSSLE